MTIGEVKRVMKRIAIISAWEPELTYLHQHYPSERVEKERLGNFIFILLMSWKLYQLLLVSVK